MKRTHRCYKMFYISCTNGQIQVIWSSLPTSLNFYETTYKYATTYKSYEDSNIDDKEQIRDLGIMMSNTATFTLHIRNSVKKVRDKMGYVLRVFQWRKRSLMLTLLKSLVIPLLGYCCQLWTPWKANHIQAIEAIQRTYTYKITEVR